MSNRGPAALLMTLTAMIGCSGGSGSAGPPQIRFDLDEAAFGQPPRDDMVAWDVISADMDRDGDADVLINWHNLAPLELFENVGGTFSLVNAPDRDPSGLFENAGVRSLYAANDEMLEAVRRNGSPGVYVWHDPDPRRDWHLLVVPDGTPVTVQLRSNGELRPNVDQEFVRESGAFTLDLEIDREAHFRVGVDRLVASQLVARASLPVFAGVDAVPMGNEASLWKDDPHGIAWVHARGTVEPEIYVTRGGLGGRLAPPHDPKTDRFFEFVGGDPLYRDVSRRVPPGFGRGRRLEWVDVDADGAAELYLGNTATPNVLLAEGENGDYEDIAGELGLDLLAADVFAWLDVDEDGYDDIVFIDESGFGVGYNRGGRPFDVVAGADIGLQFPAGSVPSQGEQFSTLALYVLDFDNDGRLDLWLTGHGSGRGHALFRGRAPSGYVDVTADMQLAGAPITNNMVFLDLENDGYVDGLLFGAVQAWLHNRGGERFELETTDPAWGLREFSRGVGVDVDGDRLQDVVLAGHRRMVLRNTTVSAGAGLRVSLSAEPSDPVGAVVTVEYASGMRRAQRYGSALATRYSQGLAPLHFGIPAGDRIERLLVRWSGGAVEEHVVAPGADSVQLRR